MVFPFMPRTISKWVSAEHDDYQNYNDLSPTKFPVNIWYIENPPKQNPGITEICLSWKTFMPSHRSVVLRIQTSSTHIKWNLLLMKKNSVPCGFVIGSFHCI